MAGVVVTARASDDIDDILSYLRRRAGQTVVIAYRRDFRAAFLRLAAHPGIGSPRTALGPEVRAVTVRPYVILHRFDRARDTVFVLRVLHGRLRVLHGRRRLALDAP